MTAITITDQTIKHVEVEEFYQRLLYYLVRDETLAIQMNGKQLGVYIPTQKKDTTQSRKAFARLNQALDRIAAQSGMDLEELIDALDPSKPFPFDDDDPSS